MEEKEEVLLASLSAWERGRVDCPRADKRLFPSLLCHFGVFHSASVRLFQFLHKLCLLSFSHPPSPGGCSFLFLLWRMSFPQVYNADDEESVSELWTNVDRSDKVRLSFLFFFCSLSQSSLLFLSFGVSFNSLRRRPQEGKERCAPHTVSWAQFSPACSASRRACLLGSAWLAVPRRTSFRPHTPSIGSLTTSSSIRLNEERQIDSSRNK